MMSPAHQEKLSPRGYESASACCHHADMNAAIRRLFPRCPPNARILDAGCGNGVLAGTLLKEGFRVTGIDVSQTGIDLCRRAYPDGVFHLASVSDDRFVDLVGTGYDIIISAEVIEHLYSPAAFLKNCRQALSDGGSLIITTPYHGYLKNLLLALKNGMDHHFQPCVEGGHIKFWSKTTLYAALRAAGFQPSAFAGIGRVPGLWKSMMVRSEKTA